MKVAAAYGSFDATSGRPPAESSQWIGRELQVEAGHLFLPQAFHLFIHRPADSIAAWASRSRGRLCQLPELHLRVSLIFLSPLRYLSSFHCTCRRCCCASVRPVSRTHNPRKDGGSIGRAAEGYGRQAGEPGQRARDTVTWWKCRGEARRGPGHEDDPHWSSRRWYVALPLNGGGERVASGHNG